MDLKPVVFAVILGWIAGDKELSPGIVDWLTAGRTGETGLTVRCQSDVLDDFVLRQVRLDSTPVDLTKADAGP
jgi:hypothetical protein